MERESSLDERKRKDAELAEERRARQIRLGHISADSPKEEKQEEQKQQKKAEQKPKSRSRARAKNDDE